MPEDVKSWKAQNAVQQPAPVQQPFQHAPEVVQPKFEPIRLNLDQKHEPVKIALHTKPAPAAAPVMAEPVRVVVQPRQQQQQEHKSEPASVPDTKASQSAYATEAEAMEAFKALLSDFKIPST